MASPQVEHGYTPIANELLEAILRTPLSSREQKCLLAVARETYGWSCKAKTVTAYRVATLTGMQRTQAARALRILKQRNILLNGSGGIGLQKNYDEWILPVRSKSDRVQTGPGPNQTGSGSDPKTGSKLDRVIGSESDPHKERKQESKRTPPPDDLGMDQYLASLPTDRQKILRDTIVAVATTRKTGSIAPSVLDGLARSLSRYPAVAVLRACQTYLERDYAGEGKTERYLLGIVRGESMMAHGRAIPGTRRAGDDRRQDPAPEPWFGPAPIR